MKKTLLAFAIWAGGVTVLVAQTTGKDEMLKNRKEFSDRTLFQQFENEMVPSAQERKLKRNQNQAKKERLLAIIDTSQIKLELKKKLQQDVIQDPFSNRLKRFMVRNQLKDLVLRDEFKFKVDNH